VTRDAKESLTALIGVSFFIGMFCLSLWLIPQDMEIPRWVPLAGFGFNLFMLVGAIVWHRRTLR
jgi:hypothetical protein